MAPVQPMIGPDLARAFIAAAGPASAAAAAMGLRTYGQALRHVWALPYGRTTDRGDWLAVLREGRGACSGKHALLAAIARENGLPVELVLVVYEMDERNTPGVGAILTAHGLTAVPEAHCCLKIGADFLDVTFPATFKTTLPAPLLHQEVIRPEAIRADKATVHRRVLARWLRDCALGCTEAQAWNIREACIAALASEASSSI